MKKPHFTHIDFKIFDQLGKKYERLTVRSHPGKVYPRGALPGVVSQVIHSLKEATPGSEYRVVRVAANQFNVFLLPGRVLPELANG